MPYSGINPDDPNTDWDNGTPFAPLPPWLAQNVVGLNPAAGPLRGGFSPYSIPTNPLVRSPYDDEQFVPNVAATGVSGMGNTQQPAADLTTGGPGRAAGQVLSGRAGRMPPPPGAAPPPSVQPEMAASGPMPPPQPRPMSPPPGVQPMPPAIPGTQPPQSAATSLTPAIEQAANTIAQGPPQLNTKGPLGVVQRLGMALLSATKLAPFAQQIVHPEWTQQMGQYAAAQKQLQELSQAQEGLQRGEWFGQQAQEGKGRYLRIGNGVFDQQAGRWVTMPTDKNGLVPIDPDIAKQRGLAPLDDGKYWVPPSVASQIVRPMKDPANSIQVTPAEGQRLGLVPDDSGNYYIPKEGIGGYIANKEKPTPAPTSESQKIQYEGVIGKLDAEGILPPNAATNQKALNAAIDRSATLTPQEKQFAHSYMVANTTPATQATNMILRMEGYEQARTLNVIDAQTGQAQTMNVEDFNQHQRQEPGRYVAAGVAVPAMQKGATFEDIQYNIDNARNAIQQLGTMDARTRAELVNALSDNTPEGLTGKVGQFLSGQMATTMTPQQRNAVIAMKNLMENALALRSVAGFGQGSEQLRNAILGTLPTAKSPDVPYMAAQLDQFQGVVNRLHHGVPSLGSATNGAYGGLRNAPSSAGVPIVQHSPSTGAYRYSIDGGKTWLPGRPPQQ